VGGGDANADMPRYEARIVLSGVGCGAGDGDVAGAAGGGISDNDILWRRSADCCVILFVVVVVGSVVVGSAATPAGGGAAVAALRATADVVMIPVRRRDSPSAAYPASWRARRAAASSICAACRPRPAAEVGGCREPARAVDMTAGVPLALFSFLAGAIVIAARAIVVVAAVAAAAGLLPMTLSPLWSPWLIRARRASLLLFSSFLATPLLFVFLLAASSRLSASAISSKMDPDDVLLLAL
jgi:hypothetical protein